MLVEHTHLSPSVFLIDSARPHSIPLWSPRVTAGMFRWRDRHAHSSRTQPRVHLLSHLLLQVDRSDVRAAVLHTVFATAAADSLGQRVLPLTQRLLSLLPLCIKSPATSSDALVACNIALHQHRDMRAWAAVQGDALPVLTRHIDRLTRHIDRLESSVGNAGSALTLLAHACMVLHTVCRESAAVRSMQRRGWATTILSAYLRVRGWMVVHGRDLAACVALLQALTQQLISTDARALLTQYGSALAALIGMSPATLAVSDQAPAAPTSDGSAALGTRAAALQWTPALLRSCSFVLQHMAEVLDPPPRPQIMYMTLKKAKTQDEYIRGNMKKNPYRSTALSGTTMHHVLLQICRELDMLDSVELFELLINDKLINLDLPIEKVFRKVWLRAQLVADGMMEESVEYEERHADLENVAPMVVVYRLKGLDGEASEEMVEHIADMHPHVVDPEVKYARADALSDPASHLGGLQALLSLLAASPTYVTPFASFFLAVRRQCRRLSFVLVLVFPPLCSVRITPVSMQKSMS